MQIQRLHFGRDPFAGIVPELPAAAVCRHDAAFDAQNLPLVHSRTALAIAACTGDFLSKQHIAAPLNWLITRIIQHSSSKSYNFFSANKVHRQNYTSQQNYYCRRAYNQTLLLWEYQILQKIACKRCCICL